MSTQANPPAWGSPSAVPALFEVRPSPGPSAEPAASGSLPFGVLRMPRPDRYQVRMHVPSLDALLPEDHRARLVWEYVEGLDMMPLYREIRAVTGHAGRDPIDPRILLALWLYATLDGVGSARQVDRLGGDHVAYQWLGGDVPVNYHTLSDFRVDQGAFLDALLTGSVAALMHEGLVTLERVAQDGVRVRASAGAASFRRRPTLEECQAQAKEQVDALRKELEEDPAGTTKRQKAARERSDRIRGALEERPDVESKKTPEDKAKTRVSTTDPEARVMKMSEGGFRPAVNVPFASDTGSPIITGVEVVNRGSDLGQRPPMVEQHQARYGRAPGEMWVDGGFAKKEDIETLASPEVGTTVYAPVPEPKKHKERDRYLPLPGDSTPVCEWRRRMGTPEAQEIYKDRASTAECVNAIARNRGMRQFLVRGLKKVRAVALWFALAHNLMRAAALPVMAALRAEPVVAAG